MMKKNIIYVALLGFMVLFSCKKDETKVTVNTDKLVTPVMANLTSNAIVVTADNQKDSVKFSWSAANYTQDLPVNYTVEIDSATIRKVSYTTTKTSITLSLGDLNTKMLGDLKLLPNITSPLEIRVISKLDNSQLPLTSERINFTLHTFKKTEVIVYPFPAIMYIPGGYQASGGNPGESDALTMYSSFGSDSLKLYEGYVNIPAACWIKFTTIPGWDATANWGSGDASLHSDLILDGQTNINIASAGLYAIRVNFVTNKYDIYPITAMGIVGDGTPGGWGASTNMTKVDGQAAWHIENVSLVGGAIKFRANDAWDVNYGPANSADFSAGTLKWNDPGAISITTPGKYDITVDFSKSAGPYKDFTYTIKPH